MNKNGEKDSEDTSSKDSEKETNEEDTEDTSDDEVVDDEKDTSEEESEEDSEKEIEPRMFFTDPKKIPKGNMKAFKQMQGVFTKKVQQASVVIDKAAAFDKLHQMPEFQSWIEEQRNGATNKKKASSRKSSDDDTDDDDDEDDAPLTKSALRAELLRYDKEREEKSNEQKIREEGEKKFAAFKKANPDWAMYKEIMQEEARKHPTLDFDDLLERAKKIAKLRDEDEEDDNEEEDEEETPKTKRTNKPNRTNARGSEKKPTFATNMNEAFQSAKKILKWAGPVKGD